jgi:methylphosphotriester-DNA--protein-cysteine methyltransferase
MPPSKRPPPPAAPRGATLNLVRKVTRTLTVDTTTDAADALAKRADMEPAQVPHTFDVEHLAGPRGAGARWRFNIPGQMLVVNVDDLPIIKALIAALDAERVAARDADIRERGRRIVEQNQELLDRLAQ